jgi:hypothetical protein
MPDMLFEPKAIIGCVGLCGLRFVPGALAGSGEAANPGDPAVIIILLLASVPAGLTTTMLLIW